MSWYIGHCEACDVLKDALALERARYNDLLKRLLPDTNPHTSARSESPSQELPKLQMPMSWKLKREILEREDRERAKLMKQFTPPTSPTTEELEKEVGI